MARLALVSRNPAMSMALAATEHSLIEIRASDLDDWLAGGEDVGVDAMVLDLGSPRAASRIIGDLRAQGRWVPVVLVAADDPGWSDLEVAELPGVDLLPLPLDPQRLQGAVNAVLRHPRHSPAPVSHPTDSAPYGQSLLDDVPGLGALPLPDLLDEASPQSATPLSVPEPEPEPEAEPVPVPEPEPEAEPVPVPEPEPEAAPEPAPTSSRRHRRRDQLTYVPDAERVRTGGAARPPLRLDPSEPPSTPELPPAVAGQRPVTEDPVVALLGDATSLYTLEEAATVVVEDAVGRSMADAGALLVPDGTYWRVAAGVSLRPLEHRLQLGPESWLVERVAGAGKGVLVEDSDVARQDLRGAPLASRTHLMAVPVPQVHAILLLARDRNGPFDESSLGALAGLAEEAGPVLQRAIHVRSLARSLVRHVDLDGSPGS